MSLEHLNIDVTWSGSGGLKWEQLDQHIASLLNRHNEIIPQVLIVHCGGNSIGIQSLKKLQIAMKSLLASIHRKLPNTLLVWSNILPRKYWRYMISSEAAEKSRKRINNSIGCFVVQKLNGALIRYPDIRIDQPKLFLDCVHLSDLGNSIFTTTIQTALSKFLTSSEKVFPTLP